MTPEQENKNIGKNIRLHRIKAGYTASKLCKKMNRLHGLNIKPGSIRNYEKGTEKVPAFALGSIAAITRADFGDFFNAPNPAILLEADKRSIHLLEAFCLIHNPATKDSLLHIARRLAKK